MLDSVPRRVPRSSAKRAVCVPVILRLFGMPIWHNFRRALLPSRRLLVVEKRPLDWREACRRRRLGPTGPSSWSDPHRR